MNDNKTNTMTEEELKNIKKLEDEQNSEDKEDSNKKGKRNSKDNVDTIKEYLMNIRVCFSPNQKTHSLLIECGNPKLNPDQMLDKLEQVGKLKEYDKDFEKFFDKTFQALECIERDGEDIDKIMKEVEREYRLIEKRIKKITDKQDTERIDKEALYEQILKGEVEQDDYENIVNKEETEEKINEAMQKNEKGIVNPTLDEFKDYYEFMEKNQTDSEKLDIQVEYKKDASVEVKIGYKGSENDEDKQQLVCNYDKDQLESFDEEVMPYLVEKHVIDSGGIKGKEYDEENKKTNSINVNGETMLIIGAGAGAAYAINEMDQNIITEEELEKVEEKQNLKENKGIARQIKRDFYNNNGLENKGTFIIIFVSVLTLITLIVFMLIKK